MSASTLTGASALPSLAERVEERAIGPCRVFLLSTPVQSVVSWRSSFLAYPAFAEGEELIQVMAVGLLDKGTKRRDRFVIAEILENRGAQLSYSSDELMVGVHGRALRDDVPDVLNVFAEQLREPSFDPPEFVKMRQQYAATLQRSLENTGSQASAALSRRLFDRAHPNYTAPTMDSLRRVQGMNVEQVRDYHDAHFGPNEMVIALVGDIDPEATMRALEEALADWETHDARAAFSEGAAPQEPGTTDVYMPDRLNLDVRIGHELRLRRDDPDYIPLYLATFILGGNFSSRLMTHVRDRKGLTYGIRAELSGMSTFYDGYFQVRVTLSQDKLDEGIEATLHEVRKFVDEGPSQQELADVKTTITGSYKVGLATTGGLATALHTNARRGFDVGYLDRFPTEVEAVTLEQVRDAVTRYIRPDRLQVTRAGTLPEQPGG